MCLSLFCFFSASLCYISLFSGCWNIAYGGGLLYGGAYCFGHYRGCFWRFSPIFLAQCIFLYISTGPNWRKKHGSKMLFDPPEIGCYFFCWDWGAHADIVVLMLRLRCLCQDWGARWHLNLSRSTSISAWAPQFQHNSYHPRVTAYFGGLNRISNLSLSFQLGGMYKKYILQERGGES